ncbi:MAG: alpha/beta hydrolase [Candidatus Thorarchaeota archaeon]|nr:MAG: alpha/beta hydrolase [Candidatus Thorarchaeota archaeon]
MLSEILLAIGVFFVGLLVWAAVAFKGWKKNLLTELKQHSLVQSTALGLMEYALVGDGPVLLVIHGAPGGYDQGLLAMNKWTDEGFSVLSISRPGYLQTPIETGPTLEEQADAVAALLDSLNITKVAVLGASTGGAVALHFALRHSDRLWAQVVVAGVSQPYTMKTSQKRSFLRRVIFSNLLMDIGVWLFDVATRYRPVFSLNEMFKVNVALESRERKRYVACVMNRPGQVEWYKRFIKTTCPLSSRNPGLANDVEQLANLSLKQVERIRCPTMIIHGTADGEVPFSHAEYTSSSISNSILYGLKGIGHIVWLGDHVDQMESDMFEFLKEHEPSTF